MPRLLAHHQFNGADPTGCHGPAGLARADAGQPVPPLHWWRSRPADIFAQSHIKALRRAVIGIGLLGEPRWPAAAGGDAAAAIGIALRAAARSDIVGPQRDLVMTALLRCALAGNPAAALVLSHVLHWLRGHDPNFLALSASWLNAGTLPCTRPDSSTTI
jgi:hypothetical protein